MCGIGPLAIDAYFATADDPINVAFGHALADFQQVVIEALSAFVFTDNGLGNGTFAYFGHFEYTDSVLRIGLKEALTLKTVERRRYFRVVFVIATHFPAGISRFTCTTLCKVIQRKSSG